MVPVCGSHFEDGLLPVRSLSLETVIRVPQPVSLWNEIVSSCLIMLSGGLRGKPCRKRRSLGASSIGKYYVYEILYTALYLTLQIKNQSSKRLSKGLIIPEWMSKEAEMLTPGCQATSEHEAEMSWDILQTLNTITQSKTHDLHVRNNCFKQVWEAHISNEVHAPLLPRTENIIKSPELSKVKSQGHAEWEDVVTLSGMLALPWPWPRWEDWVTLDICLASQKHREAMSTNTVPSFQQDTWGNRDAAR